MNIKIAAVDKEVKKFAKSAARMARGLGRLLPKKGLIEVYLVADKKMRALNKKFMKKNKPANVLSFVNPEGFPDKSLGEVYLSPRFIEKKHANSALPDFVLHPPAGGERAHTNNEKFQIVLSFMLIHGVLHILGYNHKKKNDRIKMEKKEAELLFRISNF